MANVKVAPITMSPIEYARMHLLSTLPFPKTYRLGKYSNISAAKETRETLFTLQGPGRLVRLWTTHANGTRLKLYIYVDGAPEPVLHGYAHELATAAEAIACPAIPLGGFLDGKSASLYLPIPFATSLRIDAEPDGETGDGPYFQIDYILSEEAATFPQIRQDGLRLSYDLPATTAPQSALTVIEREFTLTAGAPGELRLPGPGIIRRLEITAENPDILLLRAAFDDAITDPERLDGPFQVDAPLAYLVGPFCSAVVERLGTAAVIHFPMPFRRAAALQLLVGMGYGSFFQQYPVKVRVEVEQSPANIAAQYYFHARFAAGVPNGAEDVECLSTAGRGHLVGLHIFDTGHDHGGGDNILFDSNATTAGQLHGICGEDYFHMAYMRIWNRTPYSGCPTHTARYRHHLEAPIPFAESLVVNWGSFASQPAKTVALWYAEQPDRRPPFRDLTWQVTGPFRLEQINEVRPDALPAIAHPWSTDNTDQPVKRWHQRAQRGFVDLCHIHRRYLRPVPPSNGCIHADICTSAVTRVYAARSGEVTLLIGCDDPLRVFLNGVCLIRDEGRSTLSPFHLFRLPVTLCQGLNTLQIVAGNTVNTNWLWNGFSCCIESDLDEDELLYLT